MNLILEFIEKKLRIKEVLKFYPLWAVGLFWYLSMYPGVMTPDSYSTISYAKGISNLDDLHTTIFSVYVKLLSLNGRAIQLVTATILCLNIYALYLIVSLVFKNYSETMIIRIASLILLTPFFGPISVSIWKDSIYTPLTIIGLVFLVNSSRNKLERLTKWKLSAALFFIFLGGSFRHEGFAVLLLMASMLCLLAILFPKNKFASYYKKVSIYLLISAILIFIFQFFLSDKLNAKPVPPYQKTLSFLMDLQYVNSVNPSLLLPKNKILLDRISYGSSLQSAGTCSGSFDFYGDGFNEIIANQNSKQILLIWLEEIKLDSRETMLQARFCRGASAMPFFLSKPPIASWWPTIGIGPNSMGYSHSEFKNFIYPIGFSWSYIWKINSGVLAWPGLHLTLIIILFMFTLTGRKLIENSLIQLLVIFCISRFVIIFFSAVSQEFRYYYTVYYLSIPILSFFVIERLKQLLKMGSK